MRACVKKKLPRQNYEEKLSKMPQRKAHYVKKFFIQAKYKMHTVQKLMYNIMQICQCKTKSRKCDGRRIGQAPSCEALISLVNLTCKGEVKFESNMFFKAK